MKRMLLMALVLIAGVLALAKTADAQPVLFQGNWNSCLESVTAEAPAEYRPELWQVCHHYWRLADRSAMWVKIGDLPAWEVIFSAWLYEDMEVYADIDIVPYPQGRLLPCGASKDSGGCYNGDVPHQIHIHQQATGIGQAVPLYLLLHEFAHLLHQYKYGNPGVHCSWSWPHELSRLWRFILGAHYGDPRHGTPRC